MSLLAPFFALAVVSALGSALGDAASPALFLLALAIAIAITGIVGVLLDIVVIQRFRKAPAMMALVATVALASCCGN